MLQRDYTSPQSCFFLGGGGGGKTRVVGWEVEGPGEVLRHVPNLKLLGSVGLGLRPQNMDVLIADPGSQQVKGREDSLLCCPP